MIVSFVCKTSRCHSYIHNWTLSLQIQLSGPVSVGAQSEVGLNASCSDIYLEKVTEKVARWLEDELGTETTSNSAIDAVSIRSTEMLDQIVRGQPGPSYITPAECMPIRDATQDRLPSPAIASITSYTYSLPEVTSGGLQSLQYMRHKERLLSTDSGVECNHTSNGECPCKRNVDSLTEATDKLSTHSLHSSTYNMMLKRLLLAADYTSLGSNSKPKLVEEEAVNSDVFKSTAEQNGSYITQEAFNDMLTAPSALTTQHMGSYVRPETLTIERNNMCAAGSAYCQGGSVSTDSGHVEDKSTHSDEAITGSHETSQDIQFNSDGYITSPID